MNSKTSKLRNSRSCPNTPEFEVCSEKLIVNSVVSDVDPRSFVESRLNQECITKLEEITSNEPLRLETKHIATSSNNSHDISLFAPSLHMTNDEVSACMNEKNSPSHINPRENRNSSANIFKTPLHIALPGTANMNTPINPENKSKDIVQTTASSFTFSDSDTDWALETTINAPMPSKIEDSLQGYEFFPKNIIIIIY